MSDFVFVITDGKDISTATTSVDKCVEMFNTGNLRNEIQVFRNGRFYHRIENDMRLTKDSIKDRLYRLQQ